MSRCIDADALVKAIDGNPFTTDSVKSYIRVSVAKMPTIEERKTGKWIIDDHDEYAVCDRCGEPCASYVMGKPRDNFCKWCGADMRGEDDDIPDDIPNEYFESGGK